MKILGFTWNEILIVAMLVTITALFISLPISYNNPKSIMELIDSKD